MNFIENEEGEDDIEFIDVSFNINTFERIQHRGLDTIFSKHHKQVLLHQHIRK